VTFTSGAGTLIDIAPGGAVTPNNSATLHWGAKLSGGDLFIATAGTGSKSGKPIDLIIGPGPYDKANPSITGRNPQFEESATFDVAAIGVTADTTVTGVTFLFGTGPDSRDGGTVCTPGADGCVPGPKSNPPVPEPSALALIGGALMLFGVAWRRKPV
jgi:hypothetical protein